MSSSNKVLLVGGPKVGKKYILQKILEKQSMTWKDTSMEHIQLCQWLVDNKYYTAHLDFWTVSTAKVDVKESSVSEKLGDACEAIVFVFDSCDAGSFKAIEAWAEFVETYSPNVLLLVGNETRPNTAIEELEDRAVDFGDSNRIEYVAVKHAESKGQQTAGDGKQDGKASYGGSGGPALRGYVEKFGCDRLIEALQANMWPALKLKPKTPGGGLGGGSGAGAGAGAGASSGAGMGLLGSGGRGGSLLSSVGSGGVTRVPDLSGVSDADRSAIMAALAGGDIEFDLDDLHSDFADGGRGGFSDSDLDLGVVGKAIGPKPTSAAAPAKAAAATAAEVPASSSKGAEAGKAAVAAEAQAKAKADASTGGSAKAAPADAKSDSKRSDAKDAKATDAKSSAAAAFAGPSDADIEKLVAGAELPAGLAGMEEEGADLEAFEAMFDRIKAVRDAALAPGNNLSDAERRQRAEQTVVSMMRSMGINVEDLLADGGDEDAD